ncbi:MAG TPA: FadR/GntR family transcriptional regulator [Novosphingobium sp.]|nr:FadR/GntR family transcriptional regulator [Novosphingobium sp.]
MVARQLGTAIVTGQIAPGDALGGEIEAAGRFGVSRTAYREAIRILVAKGLLESRPKAGTHVLPRRRWNLLDPEMLAWSFSAKPDEQFVRDLFELRGIIEPEAAALAARRRNNAQLAIMHGALDVMRRHGVVDAEGQAADQTFHSAMLDASGNATLTTLAESIGAAVRWTTHFKARVSPVPRDSVPDHEAVLRAIANCDADGARQAMRELLRLAQEDMRDIAL